MIFFGQKPLTAPVEVRADSSAQFPFAEVTVARFDTLTLRGRASRCVGF